MNNEKKPVLYPLFSKVVYVKKTNINTDKILSLIKKENFKIAKDHLSNSAQGSMNHNILDKKKYKFLKNIIMKEIKVITKEAWTDGYCMVCERATDGKIKEIHAGKIILRLCFKCAGDLRHKLIEE